MKKAWRYVRNIGLLSFVFLLISSLYGHTDVNGANQDVIILEDSTEKVILDSYIEIFEDTSRTLTIEDVSEDAFSGQFKRFEGKGRPNFGYSVSQYWIRIQVDNQSSEEDWLIEVDSPKLNHLALFQIDQVSGEWTARNSGNLLPFWERELAHRNFVYEMSFLPESEQTIYLMVRTGSSFQMPLTLWKPAAHSGKAQVEYALFGIVFGISIIMALYNLFLYFSVGGRSYLYYVVFVVLNTLLFLSDTGLAFQFLWPDNLLMASRSVSTLMLLSNVAGILFAVSFLETKKFVPRIDKVLKGIFGVTMVIIVVRFLEIFFIDYTVFWRYFNFYVVYIAIISILVTIILFLYAAIVAYRQGYRPARYFLIAWSVFMVGVIVSLLVDVGIIPLTTFTKYAWQGSTLLEMVLLSFALGDRFNMMREEKEAAVLKSQQSQQLALEALRRTDKLKDEFLTNTSHELRTPLNGIIGIAETLRDGAAGELTHNVREHLSMIIHSGKRLSNLINDILDLSKLKNDELQLKRSPVQLYELVNVVLTICAPLVSQKPVVLKNQIEAELPAVYADENRVQQILYNLIGNAIKYTASGDITVSARLQKNHIEVSIADTGKGIPADELSTIFKPFHQVSSGADREAMGTGIGLNITKQLVQLHDGELKVESKVDKGSTFSFTLPISVDHNIATAEVATSVQAIWPEHREVSPVITSVQATEKKHFNIVIADDEPVNLQVLTNQLALEGYEVISMADGQSVLDHVEQEPVDLLILDIMMPNMSGYEVCRRLREQYSLTELPILMLTAKNQIQDIVTAFEVGANDYLTKPCDRKELLSRVETLIQLRQMNLRLIHINQSLEEKVAERTHELSNVNESLTMANEQLVEMAKERRQLLANIAHELGTPITLIQNYVQSVQKGFIDANHPRYLTLVSERVKVLERLIQDLFDLAKLEAGQLHLDFTQVNLEQWLQNVAYQCEQDVIQGERRFLNALTKDVTKRCGTLTCRIDEGRMAQVFSNLIWNAVKYTTTDRGAIQLEVSIMNDEVIIMIQDNGYGIDPDELPYVFDRFYRIESESHASGLIASGTGLGLAIVKEIIHHHQGRVWVESKVNEGSTFYVALPIWDEKALA